MADIELTVGDTIPPVEATLIDSAGEGINLLSSEVYFILRDSYTGEKIIDRQCSIVDSGTGEVKYEWEDGDTDEAGYYDAKFRVIFGPDTSEPDIQHFPNDNDIEIEIDDQ